MAVLPAFNGTVPIDKAGKYTAKDILDLFDKIKNNHGHYDVDHGSAESLKAVVDCVHEIYKKPAGAQRVVVSPALNVKYQARLFKFELLSDLVGWIFSVAGPAPKGADRDNYYYPLTGLYCYFLYMLLGDSASLPQMVQLTFFKQGDHVRVALGANLDKPKTKPKIRERRFDQLADPANNLCAANERNVSFVWQGNKAIPQCFGHCAETFPFLFAHSLKLPKPNLEAAGGLAARPFIALPENGGHYEYTKAGMREAFERPCENCEILLRKVGFTLAHFYFL